MNSIPFSGLEETKRHGSALFPFNIYPCTIPGDFPSVALHWHRSMEVIFVKKGVGLIQIADRTHRAEEGDIFILPPATLHALRGVPGAAMDYENIIFETEFLGSSAADICASQYLIPLSGGQLLSSDVLRPGGEGYEAVHACLTLAEALCEKRTPGFELGVKGAMLQLLYWLMTLNPYPPEAESRDTALLRDMVQYVQQCYAQPLSVAEAAARCGFSTSHFMRWFRQMSGSSFGAYVKECRLAAAAERLRKTEDKVLTIAGDCGFESLANFNRQFHARYGMTPSQYRKG